MRWLNSLQIEALGTLDWRRRAVLPAAVKGEVRTFPQMLSKFPEGPATEESPSPPRHEPGIFIPTRGLCLFAWIAHSFPVGLSHPLLHAGLSGRSASYRATGSSPKIGFPNRPQYTGNLQERALILRDDVDRNRWISPPKSANWTAKRVPWNFTSLTCVNTFSDLRS